MPVFPFLVPDDRRYTCITLQPEGTVRVGADGIRSSDDALGSKCQAFLNLNADAFVDLRVCPEYCFQWKVLLGVLSGGGGPKNQELWVLGCEALTKEALAKLVRDLRETDVRCVFDQECCDKPETFLDPVAYVFRCQQGKCCVALQFKGVPMSASAPSEVDDMVRGREIYFIENDDSSIRLVSIICSDALEFDPTKLDGYGQRAYLMLHPQLNPNPTHDRFRFYRKSLFGVNAANIDLLCLNWAKGTCSEGNQRLINRAHSGLYTQLPKDTMNPDTLEANHRSGVYFFCWEGARVDLHVATSEERCFFWKLTKPSLHQANVMSGKRRFPRVKSYQWRNTSWELSEVEDRMSAVLSECGLEAESLASTAKAMDLEVFIGLCAGEVENEGWPSPHCVSSVRVADDEILARTAYVECAAGEERVSTRVVKVAQLRSFLANPPADSLAKVPWLDGKRLSRLEGNLIGNLVGGSGTAVHLGGKPNESRAQVAVEGLYNKLPRVGRYRIVGMFLDTNSVPRCVEVGDGASIAGTGEPGNFADPGE